MQLIDLQPVYNQSAEESLIGSLFLDSELIKEIELRSEHFYFQSSKLIFETMKHLELKEMPIDIVTVVTELGELIHQVGGVAYLSELAGSVPSVANFKHYEKLVLEAWKMRKGISIANNLKEQIHHSRDVGAVSQAIQELSRIEETGFDNDFNLKESLYNVYEQLQNDTGELTGIPTGFADLDKYLHGFQDGNLIIIGARPSVGKTAFALNLAKNAAQKDACVSIFSLEMGDDQLLKRIISATGNIDATKMRSPKTRFTQDDWTNLTGALGQIEKWNLHIYDKATVTVQEIRAKLRRLHRKFPNAKHICIIDYLQLIQGSGNSNRTLEVGEISRALKAMARDFKQPIICLSQLSRNLETRNDKRPIMSDLRESGNVEQDADEVMFIHREDYFDKNTEQKNTSEIIIAKQRNGPVGTVKLAFLKEFNKFVNLERRGEG